MQPSKYQQAVLDAAINDVCNLMIQAVAGSGKTATLMMICKALTELAPRLSILALAFNKEIATTLGQKLPASVTSKTMHSLGWGIIRDNWNGCQIDKDGAKKNKVYVEMFGEKRRRETTMKNYVDELDDLVSKVRNTCTSTSDWAAIEAMAIEYDVDLDVMYLAKKPTEIAADVEAVCKKLRANKFMIDFDDMLDMPVHHKLQSRQTYDLVLVDESQDLNRLQAQFLEQLLGEQPKPVTAGSALDDLLGDVGITVAAPRDIPDRPTKNRVILVGDVRQAIYKFRGADAKSMANLATNFRATQLPLSICYRCPVAVVRKAQTIIGMGIEPSPTAEMGEVRYNETFHLEPLLFSLKPGDMVMCRTNAPLLGAALKCVRNGQKVSVRGNLDVGKSLIKLIKDVQKHADGSSMAAFITALEDHTASQIEKAMDDDKLAQATRWGEKFTCLYQLGKEMKSVDELIGFLTRVFDDDDSTGVIFSSIHRAKGLEADHAVLLQPEKLPHPMAYKANNVEAALEQERNLAYVAVTRAQRVLTLQPLPDEGNSPFPALQNALSEAAARRIARGVKGGRYGDLLSNNNDEPSEPDNTRTDKDPLDF